MSVFLNRSKIDIDLPFFTKVAFGILFVIKNKNKRIVINKNMINSLGGFIFTSKEK